MKGLRRYWGYVLLLAIIVVWGTRQREPGVLAVLSGIAALYFLFQAPLWCCAETRQDQLCRNNSSGLLMGCHIREHKWQRLKMAFYPVAGVSSTEASGLARRRA